MRTSFLFYGWLVLAAIEFISAAVATIAHDKQVAIGSLASFAGCIALAVGKYIRG